MVVLVIGTYELDDNIARREKYYGHVDPEDCAEVDKQNDPLELLGLCDLPLQMAVFTAEQFVAEAKALISYPGISA